MFAQFCVPLFTTWCNNNNGFVCYSCLHFFVYALTIVQQIFKTEICKPGLFSLHATCLHIRPTDKPVACFVLPFICQRNQSDEWSYSRMFVTAPSLYLHKCKHRCFSVVCVFCLYCLLLHFCLIVDPLFYWYWNIFIYLFIMQTSSLFL